MALKFLEESEAEQLCGETLTGWIQSAGYKGCHSAERTKEVIEETKTWAKGSTTARELMAYVEGSRPEILVVGMKGGYQCFDSTATNAKNRQVVFIDLDGRLHNYVRQPHQVHLAPQACKGHNVNVVALDNRIALLHEFGHAKQWIERPLLFDDHFKRATGKIPAEGKGRLKVGGEAKRVQGTGELGHSFPQAIQSRASSMLKGKEDPHNLKLGIHQRQVGHLI